MEEKQGRFAVGNVMSQELQKDLLTIMKNSTKYRNIMHELRYAMEGEPTAYKVTDSFQLDVKYGEDIFTGQTITVQLDENISLEYLQRYVNGKKDKTTDMLIATVEELTEDGGKFITKFVASVDTHVKIIKHVYSAEEVEEIKISTTNDLKRRQEFHVDPEYYPGKLMDTVNTEAWYSGCLPGGYIWCGEGCGGSAACTSTKAGINTLDNCCKTHDCCYHKRGVSHPDCTCDAPLCSCAQSASGSPFANITIKVAMCSSC